MGASKELMIRLKQKQINEEKHYLNDNEILLFHNQCMYH